MLSRLLPLFRRYAAHHRCLRIPGLTMRDETGQVTGYLEDIEIRQGRLWVTGWSLAEQLTLVTAQDRREALPNLARADVIRAGMAAGHNEHIGFRIDLPFDKSGASLAAKTGETQYVYDIPAPSAKMWRATHWGLVLPFLAGLVVAAPAMLRWKLTQNPAWRTRVKELLGLKEHPRSVPVLPAALFRAAPAGASGTALPVTLVMPVYNAFELLTETLGRVVQNTDLPWHLILVEDASSDDRVRPFLRDWAARQEVETPGRVTLIENAENLGFVRSVNRAFDLAHKRDHHVILLNSDAMVPAGWASRLMTPILTQKAVASVTPMSNDAEIFSVPAICQTTKLTPGQADVIDVVAQQLDPEVGLAEAPTGVGFCMAMNIDYLRLVPQFDIAFGRGYGEEVDWCQKVRARGGQHFGMAGLFVEHRGGSSFGSAQKQALIARNNTEISRRYPGYDAEVQRFISTDPLAAQRLVLAFALAAERHEGLFPIYLAHSLDGGAEIYLRDRLAGDVAGQGAAAVLRVGGPRCWRIELHTDRGVMSGETDEFELAEALFNPIRNRRVVYSCGVGAHDPVALPRQLLALRRGVGDRLEVLIHDFFPLSPSYTLLDSQGVFRGVPEAGDADPAHAFWRPGGGKLPLQRWREAWGAVMAAADEVVVFSGDSARHVKAAYPQAAGTLSLRPHQLAPEFPPIGALPIAPHSPTIGVLGNINRQKGAGVVVDLARRLEREDRGKLVLIGDLDPEYKLPASAHLHGKYRVRDIPQLIRRYGITHWLIPSIWPETFSFTTREALATGLPVLCFDLGAQAEVVRAAPRGHVIPLDIQTGPVDGILDRLGKSAGPTNE